MSSDAGDLQQAIPVQPSSSKVAQAADISQPTQAEITPWGSLQSLVNLSEVFVQTGDNRLEFSPSLRYKCYLVMNNFREVMYIAEEDDSHPCSKCCCGNQRSFRMTLTDPFQQQIIIERPYSWCVETLRVFCPPGNLLGTVQQSIFSYCASTIQILDAEGQVIFRIKGPCCTVNPLNTDDFRVLSSDGLTEVGTITRLAGQVPFVIRNFGLFFPADLDPRMKAMWIGACIYIDFQKYDPTFERTY